jgi:hypothetical protein
LTCSESVLVAQAVPPAAFDFNGACVQFIEGYRVCPLPYGRGSHGRSGSTPFLARTATVSGQTLTAESTPSELKLLIR